MGSHPCLGPGRPGCPKRPGRPRNRATSSTNAFPLPISTAPRDGTLIRHDVTGWEPIADQAAARAVPLEKVRRAGATTVVLGTVKTRGVHPRHLAVRARKPVVVVGR